MAGKYLDILKKVNFNPERFRSCFKMLSHLQNKIILILYTNKNKTKCYVHFYVCCDSQLQNFNF